MGSRVGRVLLDRLLKKFDGFSQPCFGAFIPENPALQVKLVSFGSDDLAFHGRSAVGLQAFSNSPRDVLLHRDDVLNRAVVTVGPELEAIGDVDELRRY